MPAITEEYELRCLDICFPDYFNGWHDPVMAIPMDNTVTADEFRDAFLTEYHSCWDHLCYDNKWPDMDDNQLMLLVDDALTAVGDDIVAPNAAEPATEDMPDSQYAYIACIKK